MSQKNIKQSSYQCLLRSIRKEIVSGIEDIKHVVSQHKMITYWNVGNDIRGYFVSEDIKRGEIGVFYRHLSEDINIDSKTLQDCERFANYFDRQDLKAGLSWSHCRYLLTVHDKKERRAWISKCVKNNWAARELKMNILLKKLPAPEIAKEDVIKESSRGVLHIYKILHVDQDSMIKGNWMLDCGFSNLIEAPKSNAVLDSKYFYLSDRTNDEYSLKVVSNVLVDQLYTYRAQLVRVVDGDTLLVLIDQGFGFVDKTTYTTERHRCARAYNCLGQESQAMGRGRVESIRIHCC